MSKNTQSPGAELQSLIAKHGLNCNRLAKAINMSNAMVRLMILDQSPISLAAAFRLAKFFKTKPEYWLSLQMNHELAVAAADKSLAKELSAISDVGSYSFVRKAHAPRTGKVPGKVPGKKPGKKPAAKKKTTLAGKRKAAEKIPGARQARGRQKQSL